MRIVVDLQCALTESCFRGIGRYALSLLRALISLAAEHEVRVLLNDGHPDRFDATFAALVELIPPDHIHCLHLPGPTARMQPGNLWRARAAQEIRGALIAGLQPDVLLITSLFEGFVDDAPVSIGGLTSGIPTAVIQYDLIPLLQSDRYLADAKVDAWYREGLASLRRADCLLAISESSRQEAISALGVPPAQVVNISSAIDSKFCPPHADETAMLSLHRRLGVNEAFVMYAGAADERKNLDRLIAACGRLSGKAGLTQLVLVGRMPEADAVRLRTVAERHGMASRLVLTGYLNDDDLIRLYASCAVFVLPSLHEGFGLPALEAMACGAPVLGANSTSIPEVIGWEEALFDAADVTAMASAIERVLHDKPFREALVENGRRQAGRFSWRTTAQRALDALVALHTEHRGSRGEAGQGWAEQRRKLAQRENDLVAALAALPRDGVAPSDHDLQRAAIASERVLIVGENEVRRRPLPDQIRWRIEGPFDSSYSLALLNRETARALEEGGHRVVLHSTEGPGDFLPAPDFLAANPDLARMHVRSTTTTDECDVCSRNLYPPRVADMSARVNLLHHYAWEESGFPAEWVEDFNTWLQGITCLSAHVRKIMIDHGVRVPLAVSGCGVDHWERVVATRKIALPERRLRFLHVSSCFPRKGVETLLDAWGRAFTRRDEVLLVIKTFPNPHNKVHTWLAAAREQYADFAEVMVIEDDLGDGELKALYQDCQVLVAPSFAEGFGLPMAEAMLSGLAVVTTGWGGQRDFCDDETAWLLDYRFAPAQSHLGLFDSVWAEPDVDDLACKLKELATLPAEARQARAMVGRQRLLAGSRWRDVAERLVRSARHWSAAIEPAPPRVGWVTTWNTKCGIATYSAHLIHAMPTPVTVLAPRGQVLTAPDGPQVRRCWEAGDGDDLADLSAEIERCRCEVVVVQFNYGFFNFDALERFLLAQAEAGRTIVVAMHATVDPAHAPGKRLAQLAPALQRCDRVLAHAVGDLNRLKALGLVDQVALFPHGIIESGRPERAVGQGREFLLASYGFFLPHKGLMELLEAVALLREQGHAVHLRMVNAEYPVSESAELIARCRARVLALGLQGCVELHTEFLPDAESFSLLEAADLVVFPYQQTGESASGAVRYGLAVKRPVAVTPLAIFDDISAAVHFLPGQSPADIARGLEALIAALRVDSDSVRGVRDQATRWRAAHSYATLGMRLDGMLAALHGQRVRGQA